MHLGTWRDGARTCQVTIGSDEPGQFEGLVANVDPTTSAVTFQCGMIRVTVDLTLATSFNYLDFNDPESEMAQHFEAGYPAWMRAFSEGELVLSLLLKDD